MSQSALIIWCSLLTIGELVLLYLLLVYLPDKD